MVDIFIYTPNTYSACNRITTPVNIIVSLIDPSCDNSSHDNDGVINIIC